MESLCSDELMHFGAEALTVLARSSRQLRSTALIAMSGGLTIKGLEDDKNLEIAMVQLRRCCEARFRLKRLALQTLSDDSKLTTLEPLRELAALQCRPTTLNVTSLEPLRDLKALTTLHCYHMKNVTSLGPLRDLKALATLDCHGMKNVTSLEPLRDLKALETLDCSCMVNVTSLEPLRDQEALTTLNCSRMNGVTSLEPLRDLRVRGCLVIP